QEMQLFEELRTLRREIAAEKRVAPFVIFGDVTLVDLSRRRPVHVDTFLQVHGVGRRKCEEYAERFLNVILRVSNRLGLAREVGFTNPADTTRQSTLELTMRNNSSQSHDHDAENLSLIKQQAAALFAERLSLEEVSEKLQRAL